MVQITDAEWRAFQSIPDQGYSHRAWLDNLVRERMAQAFDEGMLAMSRALQGGNEPVNLYRKETS